MPYIPYVIQKTGNGERSYDIYSRLLKDRIVFLNGEVNAESASVIVAQMLYLESEDPGKDISFYINSPGGSITDGMAIFDTMNYIKCDVSTICVGLAASMASILLAGGTKGKRYILPNASVLIHQPLGGINSPAQATDIEIMSKNILRTKELVIHIMSERTGKPQETLRQDMERDHWLNAVESCEYGLVDNVISR